MKTYQNTTIISLLLFFSTQIAIAQNIIRGQVLSQKDNKPISFCTISLKSGNAGINSDEDGFFELQVQAIPSDSLYIHALGYRLLVLTIEEAKLKKAFYLVENPIPLQTFTITKKKEIRSELKGAKDESGIMVFGQTGSSGILEAALYIPNESQQEGFIKQVAYYIARFGKHKTPFRVRIYEANEDKMPERDLLNENLIVHSAGANHFFKVDLSKYNIPFSKHGIFVSMEWLELYDKKYSFEILNKQSNTAKTFFGQKIKLTMEFEEARGRKRMNNGTWKMMNGFPSPAFQAEIEFYEE